MITSDLASDNGPTGPIVFDALAWVEYALDGPRADVVKDLLESDTLEALTPATVIAELKESLLRHKMPRTF
jgi:hypothetical protein